MKKPIAFASLCVLTLFLGAAAHAQQPKVSEQALTQKLIAEINAGLACNTQVYQLQQEVQKLQAALAKATKKDEPAKPAPKKKP